MLINSIKISNLYSFDDTTIFLGKYNVITGPNGVGKSNLLRILKRLIHDQGNGFSVSYIEDYEKFNKKNHSWIKISISFSSKESELISKLIFGKDINNLCMTIDLIILWQDSHNLRQKIKTMCILHNKLVIWNDCQADKIGFLDKNKNLSVDLFNILENFTQRPDNLRINNKSFNSILTNNQFINLLLSKPSKIDQYLLDQSIDFQGYFDLFRRDNKQIDQDIFDYCDISYSGNVNLWVLLVKIMSKNFIFLEEFRPSIETLKTKINEKKSTSPIQYMKDLQRDFSNIFPDYTFEIQGDDPINFIVGKIDNKGLIIKEQAFKLENSASGFIDVLYMLNELQSDNERIVILDEPALHLHPIKQRHFWQTLIERTNNQVIIITHSPYLVNLSLFQGNNKLINIQMKNGKSKIFPTKANQISPITLKDYNFRPEIFFSRCNILVEGPGDQAAIAAISDTLDHIFEKYSIQLINVGGKDVLEAYVPILKEYDIPHIALTDYDYNCDDEKKIPKQRDQTNDFVILEQRLEEELYKFDNSINIMKNFDPSNPCNTNKCNQPKSIRPITAYNIIKKAMSNNRKKVKESILGELVTNSLLKSEVDADVPWNIPKNEV